MNSRTSERRLRPRKQLWFPWIQLGVANGGIILDISESGLAMRAVRSLANDQLPGMRFQLSESQCWIETAGRIAWISNSGTRVGVEFVDLPEEARNQIRNWNSLPIHPKDGSAEENPSAEQIEPVESVPHATGHPVGVPPSSAEKQDAETVSPNIADNTTKLATSRNAHQGTIPVLHLPSQERSSIPHIFNRGSTARWNKSTGRTGLSLAAVLFILGFILVGSRFQRTAHGSQSREVTATTKGAALSFGGNANTDLPDSNMPLAQPIFVLQLGAMTHEENAKALAESLRRRYFPVIVFRTKTSRLYRVIVGPYTDADSTVRIQRQLQELGFEAFRTKWKSSDQ